MEKEKRIEATEDLKATLTPRVVRQALEHLYVNVELSSTTLATCGLFADPDRSVLQCARALRNLLLDAIETLRPLRPTSTHVTRQERSYEVLSLRYVSGFSVEEIAERLSLGPRQIYRDLRRAEADLTKILAAGLPVVPSNAPTGSVSAFKEEIDALSKTSCMTDLADLLQSALTTIRPFAEQKQVFLHYQKPPRAVWSVVAPGILKEIFIQILSALIQQCGKKQRMAIKIGDEKERVEVDIRLHGPDLAIQDDLLQHALMTAQSLAVPADICKNVSPDVHEITLSFRAAHSLPILVVEDNPGICELYQRYLQGSEWHPVIVSDAGQVEAYILSLQPAAIVLDILMPELDGWSLLQQIKTDPKTGSIPIIVCSVINDPALATALGANASLKKPLSRLELIGTLSRVTQTHNEV